MFTRDQKKVETPLSFCVCVCVWLVNDSVNFRSDERKFVEVYISSGVFLSPFPTPVVLDSSV